MRHLALLCLSVLHIFELSSSLVLRTVPGSTLVLPCLPLQRDFTGTVITWKYNGTNITGSQVPTESSGSLKVIKDGLYLSISPITAANEGNYVCVVLEENNIEWRKTYTIEVDDSSDYTVTVNEGSTINLPCHRPPFAQAEAYALWFKDTAAGERTRLTPVEVPSPGQRLEWLYSDPTDNDQTITLKELAMVDAGIYHCESAEGEKFNAINLIVKVAPTTAPHSCNGFTEAWEPCHDQTSHLWAPILEESMADFSMKLYSHLSQSQPSKNLLYSPISISGVLSHLLLGARGDTRRAMETALCVPHGFHCVHFQMKRLKESLNGSLLMASQIYYNPSMNLSESFTNQSLVFYDAEPVRLLSSSEENTEMINSWVAKHTDNKITHMVDSVPTHTELILLNAVSFSGQWKVKFDTKAKKVLFMKQNGDLVKVPALYSSSYMLSMEYVSEMRAQVGRFSLSGDSSLYILLPRTHKPADLRLVEEKMTDAAVRQMIAQMKRASPQSLEVTLPKIKLDIQTNLNTLLRKLGLSSLFEGANLCGLYPDNQVLLSDARHRAFLALTEEGVEAGAATSFSFSRSFASFSALRPFILLLWSEQANVPLFISRVMEP